MNNNNTELLYSACNTYKWMHVCHSCWWLLTNITPMPSSHSLSSFVFSIPNRPAVKIRLLWVSSVCVVCACKCLCWLLLPSSREGISAAPLALIADLSTNYRLSVDFHGSGWSSKRKGFHSPDHEIFTVKSLFLKGYIFMIGACVSGVLEWCSAVFTIKVTHESAILLRPWILHCCSFWCTRKLHGGLEQMNFSSTGGKAVGWQRCIWTD